MAERIDITDDIAVGGQPSHQDLDRLAKEGYRSVFNLRAFGEEDQPMQPDEEGEEVENRGMEYHHMSVTPDQMNKEMVDEFRQALDNAAKPVFVHCKGGKRAGAFSVMKIATDQGISGEQTLEEAKRMGFECDSERLENFVRDYVNSRTAGGAGWATGEEVGPEAQR